MKTRYVLRLVAFAGASIMISSVTFAQSIDPAAFVDALNGVFGKHVGFRASHAKGLCGAGQFVASAQARELSLAEHFGGKPTQATVRFSVGGGNPKASDKSPSLRGLAVRFHLGKDANTDLVMISAPVFQAATPKSFLEFLQARRVDPQTGKPDPAKVNAYNDSHPDSKPQIEYLAKTPVPVSYATTSYWAVHAYKFVSSNGEAHFGRWEFRPVAGLEGLSKAQREAMPDDFLQAELQKRIAENPVEFDVLVQLAERGDPTHDPTVQWPETRRKVKVGRLQVTELTADRCDGMMFAPLPLPDGIEASDDPILPIRNAAYAISFGRRQK